MAFSLVGALERREYSHCLGGVNRKRRVHAPSVAHANRSALLPCNGINGNALFSFTCHSQLFPVMRISILYQCFLQNYMIPGREVLIGLIAVGSS